MRCLTYISLAACLTFYGALALESNQEDESAKWEWISRYNPDENEEPTEEPDDFLEETSSLTTTPSSLSPKRPRWYFVVKPGYYYFTDPDMRIFFDNGGFTIRAETGCRVWQPLYLWVDAGYLEKKGERIGGSENLKIQMASISLGLKAIWYAHERIALYAGAAPRLLMTLIHNNSPYVRERDDHLGIGGGFNGGVWIFPFPQTREIFFDFFADYTLNQMELEEDLVSSYDNDVDASGLSFGIGLGVRF